MSATWQLPKIFDWRLVRNSTKHFYHCSHSRWRIISNSSDGHQGCVIQVSLVVNPNGKHILSPVRWSITARCKCLNKNPILRTISFLTHHHLKKFSLKLLIKYLLKKCPMNEFYRKIHIFPPLSYGLFVSRINKVKVNKLIIFINGHWTSMLAFIIKARAVQIKP